MDLAWDATLEPLADAEQLDSFLGGEMYRPALDAIFRGLAIPAHLLAIPAHLLASPIPPLIDPPGTWDRHQPPAPPLPPGLDMRALVLDSILADLARRASHGPAPLTNLP